MHGHVRRRSVRHAAAHLKAAITHCTLDEQAERLDGERLQEEHIAQPSSPGRGSTRQLEVGRARKYDAAVHDVLGDQCV